MGIWDYRCRALRVRLPRHYFWHNNVQYMTPPLGSHPINCQIKGKLVHADVETTLIAASSRQ
eukprot:scaffold653242_cov61-Prasinocladus_malaysianus.AAC.1